MQHFDNALVLLRLDGPRGANLETNIFIAHVRLNLQRMTIQRNHNGEEGQDYWDFHYVDFTEINICGTEVECHVTNGVIYLAFPFRNHIGLRSETEFKTVLQNRLQDNENNVEINEIPVPPLIPVRRQPIPLE